MEEYFVVIKVLFKNVNLIDYEGGEIIPKPITDAFNDYIAKLVNNISQSDSLQLYNVIDQSTQVINLVIGSIAKLNNGDSEDLIVNNVQAIAQRLLNKEIVIQEKIQQMGVNIKKGSLMQAILKSVDEIEPNDIEYLYMLTKVEHNEFIDEESYNLQRGFPIDKITLWKSCLIHIKIINDIPTISDIKIFLDNKATYWTKDFLEVEPIIKDEQNTKRLFTAIQKVLTDYVYKESQHDYFLLRNNLIGYMRKSDLIVYNDMIKSIFKSDITEELSTDIKDKVFTKLETLPETHHFDRQFTCVNSAIGARIIKKSYNLSDDIDLIIKKDIEGDIKNSISAGEEQGKKFIKIYTINSEAYNTFK